MAGGGSVEGRGEGWRGAVPFSRRTPLMLFDCVCPALLGARTGSRRRPCRSTSAGALWLRCWCSLTSACRVGGRQSGDVRHCLPRLRYIVCRTCGSACRACAPSSASPVSPLPPRLCRLFRRTRVASSASPARLFPFSRLACAPLPPHRTLPLLLPLRPASER